MSRLNSGYQGYSMSNRAAEAYADNERPFSKWTKRDIVAAIEEFVAENEVNFTLDKIKKMRAKDLKALALCKTSWHHTSLYVNRTDFYSIDEDRLAELTDKDIDILSRDNDVEDVETNTFKGDIYYLEWSGSRKHPKATEKVLKDVNVEERGCFYYITNDSGELILKKKIGSNGTRVIKR